MTLQKTVDSIPYLALGLLLVLVSFACGVQSDPAPEPPAHVVVIGVDGMSPDGIRNAHTPNIDGLLERGAHSFHARAVMPTSSSSNWASMIMGAGPERHGITSNSWEREEHVLPPVCEGESGTFPTMFSILRAQRRDAVIGVFHDWDGFGRLVEPGVPDVVYDGAGPDDTVRNAAAFITEEGPLLTFIHLDHVDGAGHSEGHGSPAYYAAVANADSLIGEVIQAIDDAGILAQTTIIVSSDHGGDGTGHGGVTPGEMEIPWIIAGPGLRQGFEISAPIDTYDTAATVLDLLAVTPDDCWTARPVRTAYER